MTLFGPLLIILSFVLFFMAVAWAMTIWEEWSPRHK
jgi:hypothetical protein